MAGGRKITIEFLGDADKLNKTTDGVESRFGKFGSRLQKVGHVAGLAFAGMAAAGAKFAHDSIDAASDAQQSIGGTQAVFGKYADSVIRMSNRAAKAYGLSANDYRESANLIGAQLKNQGVAQDKLAGSTKNLVALGADLSATYGGTTKEAVEALSSALKGEFDPIERYGISLKQSTINTEALAIAHVKSTSAFNKLSAAQQTAAKRQATLAILDKQSADAQGQFAKQSNTLAEQQQILKARFANVEAEVGRKLLPVVSDLVELLGKAITFTKEHSTMVKILAGTFAGLTAGLWAAGKAIKAWEVITKVAAAAQKAFNFVLAANPIGLVITAIAALAAGLVIAYKKSATFRKIVNGAFEGIAKAAKFMWNDVLRPVFKFILDAWINVAGGIIKGAAKAFGWVPGIGGKLRGAAAEFDKFKDQVDRALSRIPDHVDTRANLYTAGAIGDMRAYTDRLRRLNGSVARTYIQQITTHGSVAGGGHPIPYRLAEGGIVKARPGGTLAVLGEGGRDEAVVPLGRGGRAPEVVRHEFAIDLKLDGRTVQRLLLKEKRLHGGKALGLA